MSQGLINRDALAKYLGQVLDITRFRDYCPNGLQVEGREEVRKIVTGVTASLALIEAAVNENADTILVHHGYFWRGEDPCVRATRKKRLKLLLAHDINLYAYHLPLDKHPQLGNNAQLAQHLHLTPDGRFGADEMGWMGRTANAAVKTVGDLVQVIQERLGRVPQVIGDFTQPVERIGWCTGAAQNMLSDAIDAGANVYLSGEISEPTVHLAREAGVTYIACGHHATERYGVKALGEYIEEQFSVEHCFIDITNPV